MARKKYDPDGYISDRDNNTNMLWAPIKDRLQATIRDYYLETGLIVELFEGYRSPTRQDELYRQGRSNSNKPIVTNSRAFESWHQFGLAGDLVFGGERKWTWEGGWTLLGKIGKRHGLEWGGKWGDRPHFQFNLGMSILEAQKLLKSPDGIFAVWYAMNRRLVEKKLYA